MKVTPLAIAGAWLIESPVYPDDRGIFREWFKKEELKEYGLPAFDIRQANTSISKKGVIRGIHFSSQADGQSKIVTCTSGLVQDVIVDLRTESKTFGRCISVELNARLGLSVFISKGLGHGFQALEDDSVLTYLLDKEYSPVEELTINPIDKDLEVVWSIKDFILSDKDSLSLGINEYKRSRNE
jgi:dTDP-4-dehydrorhamnose 3,5-epimerase